MPPHPGKALLSVEKANILRVDPKCCDSFPCPLSWWPFSRRWMAHASAGLWCCLLIKGGSRMAYAFLRGLADRGPCSGLTEAPAENQDDLTGQSINIITQQQDDTAQQEHHRQWLKVQDPHPHSHRPQGKICQLCDLGCVFTCVSLSFFIHKINVKIRLSGLWNEMACVEWSVTHQTQSSLHEC